MEWTKEKVMTLIDLYRSHAELWDTRHINYRDQAKRQENLMAIARVFGTEKAEIEKKIRYLQSHFARELRREKRWKSKDSFDGSYRSKWFAFPAMLFLVNNKRKHRDQDESYRSFVQNHKKSANHGQGAIPDTDIYEDSKSNICLLEEQGGNNATYGETNIEYDEDSVISYVQAENLIAYEDVEDNAGIVCEDAEDNNTRLAFIQSGNISVINPLEVDAEQDNFHPSTHIGILAQKKSEEAMENKIRSVVKGYLEEQNAKDEYSLFGEQVAAQLRRLPTEHSKIMAQHIINTTLFEARLGKYNQPSSE